MLPKKPEAVFSAPQRLVVSRHSTCSLREDKLDHLAQPYPVTERKAHELLRSADAAMYQAERDGQRQVRFHGKVR